MSTLRAYLNCRDRRPHTVGVTTYEASKPTAACDGCTFGHVWYGESLLCTAQCRAEHMTAKEEACQK